PGVDPENVDDGLVRRGFSGAHRIVASPSSCPRLACTSASPEVVPPIGSVNEWVFHLLHLSSGRRVEWSGGALRRHRPRSGVVPPVPAGVGLGRDEPPGPRADPPPSARWSCSSGGGRLRRLLLPRDVDLGAVDRGPDR